MNGDDGNDGVEAPVRSIARGIKLAQPGDTIHLRAGRYAESAVFHDRHGEASKPIVLDGHGAVLDGSEPIGADVWEDLGGGLYRKVGLVPRIDDAIIGRWFFLFDGVMEHMGRTAKGPSAPLRAPSELTANQWTYVADEDAFYIRVKHGTSLTEASVRYPKRSSAVVFSGSGSHIVVRNITGRHVYNDGFNIHGAQRNLVFENIAAIECGDDGFSAHEDAECRIDGFTSIGNSTGLCDTVSSVTHYRNVLIQDCLGYDIYFIGDSAHSMENVRVRSTAARTLEVARHTDRPQDGPGKVLLRNVWIERMGASVPQPRMGEVRIQAGAQLTLEDCTFESLNFVVVPGAEVSISNSVMAGSPATALIIYDKATWSGEGNRYDLKTLRFGKRSFTSQNFADFQKLLGSEAGSTWSPAAEHNDAGADAELLPPLPGPK